MNYDLLRPFDLEAAKRGDLLTNSEGFCRWSYVAGPDVNGQCVFVIKKDYLEGRFTNPISTEFVRMAPLAWVDEKPVYPGDVLYYNEKSEYLIGEDRTVDSLHKSGRGLVFTNTQWGPLEELTWERPKVPLCEVEGKPVYPGDVLYLKKMQDRKFIVGSKMIAGYSLIAGDSYDGEKLVFGNDNENSGMNPGNLTWTPPKQKKEMWVNVYPDGDGYGHPTKEKADQAASRERIACVRLEYEV